MGRIFTQGHIARTFARANCAPLLVSNGVDAASVVRMRNLRSGNRVVMNADSSDEATLVAKTLTRTTAEGTATAHGGKGGEQQEAPPTTSACRSSHASIFDRPMYPDGQRRTHLLFIQHGFWLR